jgi:hypothetical protein
LLQATHLVGCQLTPAGYRYRCGVRPRSSPIQLGGNLLEDLEQDTSVCLRVLSDEP